MSKLKREDVNYIEQMTKEIVRSLRELLKYYEVIEDTHIYSSPERAKFKRLRVELSKKLIEIQRIIYNE